MADQSTAQMRIVKSQSRWIINATGSIYGETENALLVLEQNRDPVVYFPRDHVAMAFFDKSEHRTFSPLKGWATFYSIDTKSRVLENVAWSYEEPTEQATALSGYLAFAGENLTVEEL